MGRTAQIFSCSRGTCRKQLVLIGGEPHHSEARSTLKSLCQKSPLVERGFTGSGVRAAQQETETQAPEAAEQPHQVPVGSSPGKRDTGPVVLPGGEAVTPHFPANLEMGSPVMSRAPGWDTVEQGGPRSSCSRPCTSASPLGQKAWATTQPSLLSPQPRGLSYYLFSCPATSQDAR